MLNKIFKYISKTRFWIWFAKTFISNFTFRIFGYPEFPMEKHKFIYGAIKNSLKFTKLSKDKDYIFAFVSRDTKSLAYKIIGFFSDWTHAGIMNFPDIENICHMQKDGIKTTYLLDLLKTVDNFAVIRYEINKENLNIAHKRIRNAFKNNIQYDYGQEINFDKFYCSELIWYYGKELVLNKNFKLKEIKGRKVFTPDDVFESGEIIFLYTGKRKLKYSKREIKEG